MAQKVGELLVAGPLLLRAVPSQPTVMLLRPPQANLPGLWVFSPTFAMAGSFRGFLAPGACIHLGSR